MIDCQCLIRWGALIGCGLLSAPDSSGCVLGCFQLFEIGVACSPDLAWDEELLHPIAFGLGHLWRGVSGRWYPFPRLVSASGAGPGMVTEFPALSALIWETIIQNFLHYHVVGLGSFRHRRNSDVPRELGDVFQFDCNQRSYGPFDVRLCWFNF